jgi:hypothetical protein
MAWVRTSIHVRFSRVEIFYLFSWFSFAETLSPGTFSLNTIFLKNPEIRFHGIGDFEMLIDENGIMIAS